jgi:hypothetical protein
MTIVYNIDYDLATKFIDTNKTFCMDQRRAYDGTLKFTSRDAYFGAYSRHSNLECLGFQAERTTSSKILSAYNIQNLQYAK